MKFMKNLKTHKMELKACQKREPQKKKNVAFKASTSKKSYKKNAMKATWDVLDTELDEEVDNTKFYFMALGDNAYKVQSELTLDDVEIIVDEISMAFTKVLKNMNQLELNVSN